MPGESAGVARRVPSLDGLRACSIALVIFDHLSITGAIPLSRGWINFGNLGVRIFFVISGFIITRLLLEELRARGTVSLRSFYIRRCFRILPAWAAFLGIMLAAAWAMHRLPPSRDILALVTFNADYFVPQAFSLQHLWSLSVEEKFYLLWPVTLLLAGRKRARWVVWGVIGIVPLVRFFFALEGAPRLELLWRFHNCADSIATGCWLAFSWRWLERRLPRVARVEVTAGAVVLLLAAAACETLGVGFWLVGPTLMNFFIAVMIFGFVKRRDWWLNTAAMTNIGLWSYAIYLWQQPLILSRVGSIPLFPINVAAAVAISVASYYLIERRAVVFGRVLAKRG